VTERGELRPAVTRMTCSDVMRVRRGDNGCPGEQQAGAPRSRSLDSNVNHPRLARSRPARAVRFRKRPPRRASLAAVNRPPIGALDAPPPPMKGLRVSPSKQRARVRKRVTAQCCHCQFRWYRWTALRGHESSRVRPDHVLCCIAPAREIVRKGEGISGRGNSASFTRCEANRPRRDESSVALSSPATRRGGSRDRGVRGGSSL
jgi:hypothetical protein